MAFLNSVPCEFVLPAGSEDFGDAGESPRLLVIIAHQLCGGQGLDGDIARLVALTRTHEPSRNLNQQARPALAIFDRGCGWEALVCFSSQYRRMKQVCQYTGSRLGSIDLRCYIERLAQP